MRLILTISDQLLILLDGAKALDVSRAEWVREAIRQRLTRDARKSPMPATEKKTEA